jgi:hypothetical protein
VKIAYICPTYQEEELHSYTMSALDTFFTHTAGGLAIVVDDASKGFKRFIPDIQKTPKFEGQEVIVHHFDQWGGLTRSWNKGLEIAAQAGATYACPSNNDILFTPHWYEGLLHALENGYALAGPLSNAPGITAKGRAEVWRYVNDYKTTDDRDYIDGIADELRKKNMGKLVEAHVNGFFQIGKMSSFEEGRYDDKHYYCPRNDKNSRGQRNPTPLMTLNEDELQGRWAKKKWKFAVVLSSFLFHYRAVTRGGKHRKGRWFRKSGGA